MRIAAMIAWGFALTLLGGGASQADSRVALLIGDFVFAVPAHGGSQSLPLLIPSGYDGLDPRDKYPDAGIAPDEYLFQEEVDNNEWAATPSP